MWLSNRGKLILWFIRTAMQATQSYLCGNTYKLDEIMRELSKADTRISEIKGTKLHFDTREYSHQLYGCYDTNSLPEICLVCPCIDTCKNNGKSYLDLFGLYEMFKVYLRLYVKSAESGNYTKLCEKNFDTLDSIFAAIRELVEKECFFDIVLLERESDSALWRDEVVMMMDMFLDSEKRVLPMEICSKKQESSALGFISFSAADSLDFDYTELKNYISSIMDDINKENDTHIYKFKDLNIWMSR